VYADVDRALWAAAELSVRAQLAYLRGRSGAEPPASGMTSELGGSTVRGPE
jgi:hypothetical protein